MPVTVDKLRRLAYFAYVRCGITLWVSNTRYNGIYSIDTLSGDTVFRGRIPRYDMETRLLHSRAIKYEDSLFFFPQLGNSIDEFNMITGEIKSYPITIWDKTGNYIVEGYVQGEDKIFIIPRCLKNPIGVFYIKTGEFEVFKSDIFGNLPNMPFGDMHTLLYGVVNVGDKVWATVYETSCVIELDLISGKERIHTLSAEQPVHAIGYDGYNLWLGQGNDVVLWDAAKGIQEIYENIIVHPSREDNFVAQFVFHEDDIYVFPQWLGVIRKINRKTKEIYSYEILPPNFKVIYDGMEKWRDLRNAYIYDNEVIVNPINRNMELHIRISDNYIYGKEYLADLLSVGIKGEIYNEKEISLQEFINMQIKSEKYGLKPTVMENADNKCSNKG